MHRPRFTAAVIGATGTGGQRLIRRLRDHPSVSPDAALGLGLGSRLGNGDGDGLRTEAVRRHTRLRSMSSLGCGSR